MIRWARVPRLARALAALVLIASASGTRADPRFDAAVEVSRLGGSVGDALNALDADAFVRLMTDAPDTLLIGSDFVADNLQDIALWLDARIAGHRRGTFAPSQPRVLLESPDAWLELEWTWGAESGILIALCRVVGGRWTLWKVDLDGGVRNTPQRGFDARVPHARIAGAIDMMEQAATAMTDGDFAVLERFLREDFRFTDNRGRESFAPESFIIAALTPTPRGVDKERMTLFIADGGTRAIAFQDLPDRRVSLVLQRSGGQWQVAAASLSTPLDVLPVDARRRLPAMWGRMKASAARDLAMP
ncbi:hypothetical protein FJZ36_13900 [Candidatus Poribacteria bacterium]|nr:hypothetical protein [Candidatus Poribacteria bacterium]